MLKRRSFSGLFERLRGFASDRRASVAMLTAVSVPAILFVGLGAIQLNALYTDKSLTQDIADSAALWGAQQLTVTQDGVTDRAIAWANAQLTTVASRSTVNVTATKVDARRLKVVIDTHRPGFFMNMMPLGGFDTHAESVAEGVSQSPLCVLINGANSGDMINLTNSSKLQALECMVHSDKNIQVAGTAWLRSQNVEAGGTVSGPITPAAYTGAPAIPDPFASLSITRPATCVDNGGSFTGTQSLPAGRHCGDVLLSSGGTLTLAAGDHYFDGLVRIRGSARLVAPDAVLIFGPGSSTDWNGAADVSLEGRRAGPLAGFVLIVDRGYSASGASSFQLDTDHLSTITGAIYSPNTILKVNGTAQAGQSSGWTVIAGRGLELSGSPTLVINSNYTGFVPVPYGVGNKQGVTNIER